MTSAHETGFRWGGLLLRRVEVTLCNSPSPRVLIDGVYVGKEQVPLMLAIVFKGEKIHKEKSLLKMPNKERS